MPRIKVKQEHIDDAIPNDSGHCMTAEAIKEAKPNVRFVSVDIATIRYSDPEKGLRHTFLTPRDVQVAIIQFDQGIKPRPFVCDLRGGQTTSMKVTNKRTGRKRRRHRLGRRRLVGRRRADATATIVGGTPPPQVLRYGQRRAYGLRAFPVAIAPVEATPAQQRRRRRSRA